MNNESIALEELVNVCNKALETPLTEAEVRIIRAYVLDAAAEETVADLPRTNDSDKSVSTYSWRSAANAIQDEKKDHVFSRGLRLLYSMGITEECLDCLDSGIKRSSNKQHIFDALGPRLEMEYYLDRLHNQYDRHDIKQASQDLTDCIGRYPGVLEALAETGSDYSRLRACSWLYARDPQKYGAILDRALQSRSKEWSPRLLFTSCAFTDFKHRGLCGAFRDRWRTKLRWVVHTTAAMKYYYPAFLDQEIYSKVESYETHRLGECLFFAHVGKAVGMEQDEILTALIEHFGYWDDVLEFVGRNPEEMIKKVLLKELTADSLFQLYRCYKQKQWDPGVITEQLAEHYTDILRLEVKNAFQEKENGEGAAEEGGGPGESVKRQAQKDVIAFLTGQDDGALDRLLVDSAARNYVEEKSRYLLSRIVKLLGIFCKEARFEGIRGRCLAFCATFKYTYTQVSFVEEAMSGGWAMETALKALFSRPQIPEEAVLRFYDECLLTKEERDSIYTGQEQSFIDELLPYATDYVFAHLPQTLEYLQTQSPQEAPFGLLKVYYENNPEADPTPLVRLFPCRQSNLMVRAMRYIIRYPQLRPELEKLAEHPDPIVSSAAGSSLVLMVMRGILLDEPLFGMDAAFDVDAFAAQHCPNAKAVLPFTDSTQWPDVRRKGSEEVLPKQVVACYVGLYGAAKLMQRVYPAEKLRPYFNENDMAVLAALVYNDWRSDQSKAKHKGVMVLYAVHCGDDAITALKKAFKEFMENRETVRGIATIGAMAASLSTRGLITVDTIARTSRDKKVKNAGKKAISACALALGITEEEMGDRVMPDMGLDQKGELLLNTGRGGLAGRTFKVVLHLDLSVKLFNESGTEVKTFPACSAAKDDADAHKEAKALFSTIKKEIRSIVKAQGLRLDQSFLSERCWSTAEYEKLFIQNPIMQRFATSLVFGTYTDGVLRKTFRCAGDGTYSNRNDEPVVLPEDALIRLVHPLELTPEQKSAWLQQLDDYDLTQPILQLLRPVYDPAEIATPTYTKFAGAALYGGSTVQLFRQGWYFAGTGDGGGYYCLYYHHKPTGLSACLTFGENEALYAGGVFEESATVDEIVFFKTGTVIPSYDFSIQEQDIIPIHALPKRMFSEVIYGLVQARLDPAPG